MSTVEKLLAGSIDMHVHASPDPRMERRLDALQASFQAREAGMIAAMLSSGLTETELERRVKMNPARLLNLE